MEMTFRYRIKPGKVAEHVAWVQHLQTNLPEPPAGWTYKETRYVVQGFGDYDAEDRWELDGYASLGSGPGSDEFQKTNLEFFSEFYDDRFPMTTTLTKTADDVFVPDGF